MSQMSTIKRILELGSSCKGFFIWKSSQNQFMRIFWRDLQDQPDVSESGTREIRKREEQSGIYFWNLLLYIILMYCLFLSSWVPDWKVWESSVFFPCRWSWIYQIFHYPLSIFSASMQTSPLWTLPHYINIEIRILNMSKLLMRKKSQRAESDPRCPIKYNITKLPDWPRTVPDSKLLFLISGFQIEPPW